MKIYILGAGGFIGKNLCNYLLSKTSYQIESFSSLDCDLLYLNNLEKKLSEINKEDALVMTSSITRLKENSLGSMIKNITMAENVAKFIEKKKISHLTFLSTSDIYGIHPSLPIHERLLPEPNDYYSLSKLTSEFILKNGCSLQEVPLLILRVPGVYGKWDEGKSTINKIINSAIKNKKITILGNGEDKRDFVYVEDLCKIIQRGIEDKIESTTNIATGKNYSIKELANIIKKDFFKDIEIEFVHKDKQNRPGEIFFDISLLKKNFPDIKLKEIHEGLDLYIRGYKCF
jgi:UDP-glucose 4-epimerase